MYDRLILVYIYYFDALKEPNMAKRGRPSVQSEKKLKKMKTSTSEKHTPIAILKKVLSSSELSALRKEVDIILSKKCVDLLKSECVVDIFEGIARKDDTVRTERKKYFETRQSLCALSKSEYDTIRNLLLLKLPNCLRDVLKIKTNDVFLFNEHYVVKPARSNMEFRWHKDGDLQLVMLRALQKHPIAYYSFWCALDSMSLRNGTLRFPNSQDLCVDAGDVILFDSETLHSSGKNVTRKPRRVFYAQYSTEPIRIPPHNDVLSFAVPCMVSKCKVV